MIFLNLIIGKFTVIKELNELFKPNNVLLYVPI